MPIIALVRDETWKGVRRAVISEGSLHLYFILCSIGESIYENPESESCLIVESCNITEDQSGTLIGRDENRKGLLRILFGQKNILLLFLRSDDQRYTTICLSAAHYCPYSQMLLSS